MDDRGMYTKQYVDRLLSERDDLQSQVERLWMEQDWLWKKCNITLYLPQPEYPIEHNPHARKDARSLIESRRVLADTAPAGEE